MKPTTRTYQGLSYHGVKIFASYNELESILGEHHSTNHTPVNCYTWFMETDSGDGFIISDMMKSSDYDFSKSTNWSIDSKALCISMEIKEILENRLKEIRYFKW